MLACCSPVWLSVIRPGVALYSCSIVLTRCSRPFSLSAARLLSPLCSLLSFRPATLDCPNALHCHFISGSGVIKGSLGPLQPGFPNLRLRCTTSIPPNSPGGSTMPKILKIFSFLGKQIAPTLLDNTRMCPSLSVVSVNVCKGTIPKDWPSIFPCLHPCPPCRVCRVEVECTAQCPTLLHHPLSTRVSPLTPK